MLLMTLAHYVMYWLYTLHYILSDDSHVWLLQEENIILVIAINLSGQQPNCWQTKSFLCLIKDSNDIWLYNKLVPTDSLLSSVSTRVSIAPGDDMDSDDEYLGDRYRPDSGESCVTELLSQVKFCCV